MGNHHQRDTRVGETTRFDGIKCMLAKMAVALRGFNTVGGVG